jgi:hypothetical protein
MRRFETDVVLMSNWVTHRTNHLAEKPRERIINCDRTCWLVRPDNLLTWVRKPAVSVRILPEGGGKQEEHVTVPAFIRADGTKLPLMFIAEGTTRVIEET